jgi:formylglycine-generating enzyme required for sulfatase activity
MENKCWNGLFRKYVEEDPGKFANSKWQLGGKRNADDVGAEDPRLPVLRVTVDEAYGFAIWLAGERNGHLPSVKQWDTAAGLYRPQKTGSGPFLEPFQANEIAVDRAKTGPMRVGEAAKDISPFGDLRWSRRGAA